MNNQEVLNKFGQTLMREVRDRSIRELDRVMTGATPQTRAEMTARLSSLNPEQISAVQDFMVMAVDRVLFCTLDMLEQHETYGSPLPEWMDGTEMKLLVCGEDVVQLSDGLAGELFGDGWIQKFSQQPEPER